MSVSRQLNICPTYYRQCGLYYAVGRTRAVLCVHARGGSSGSRSGPHYVTSQMLREKININNNKRRHTGPRETSGPQSLAAVHEHYSPHTQNGVRACMHAHAQHRAGGSQMKAQGDASLRDGEEGEEGGRRGGGGGWTGAQQQHIDTDTTCTFTHTHTHTHAHTHSRGDIYP